MDVDPDHVVEHYDDDDITVLSHTTSIANNSSGFSSGREQLSMIDLLWMMLIVFV